MCEHLRMDPSDDPEQRIRELERPLAERASELGTDKYTAPASPPPTQPWTHANYPPPPPGPPAPWPGYADPYPPAPRPRGSAGAGVLFLLGVVIFFVVAGGVTAYLMFSGSGRDTGGDGSTAGQTTSRSKITIAAPQPVPSPSPAQPPQASTAAPGETVIVSGINEHKTIACNGNAVTVSGIENTVEITGHCSTIGVSGIQNTITAESADSIGVSGFENHVTYRSGTPQVANSGQDNIVEQG